MNIEAKGENEDIEETSLNLYEMVKECVINGNNLPGTVNELLDINANSLLDKKLQNKKTRAT